MIVVADSTPLIYLAVIGRFDLLQTLYGRIVIPQAVLDVVATRGTIRPGAA
jgi:predicted nucleic acid-binding protein